MVAAHTSAGKTVVAEYAFAMALRWVGSTWGQQRGMVHGGMGLAVRCGAEVGGGHVGRQRRWEWGRAHGAGPPAVVLRWAGKHVGLSEGLTEGRQWRRCGDGGRGTVGPPWRYGMQGGRWGRQGL